MRKIKILSVVALLVFNIGLLSTNTFANEVASDIEGLTKGIKGSINGVDTCHCPDDKANCYCSQN